MQPPDIRELEVFSLIGTGACGKVYRARDSAGRALAVKVFDPAAVNPALLEEATARLEEAPWPKNAVEEYSADYRGKQLLRVSKLHADEKAGVWTPRSLQHRLERFPGDQSWPVVLEILTALADLHDRRVAHGNLKPGNVFFDESGRVCLTDWALGTMPGVGTLEYTDAVLYQPPDQLREPEGYLREKGYRWDVFAFGVLAFRLLTGAFPRCSATFDQVAPEPGKTRREGIAANLRSIAKSVESQPEIAWPDSPATSLEKAYRGILDRCLSLNQNVRPANAGEILQLFHAADKEQAGEQQRDAILDQQRRARRSAWRANVAAGVLAGAVVILSLLWQMKKSAVISEEEGRKTDVERLQAAFDASEAEKASIKQAAEEERKTLQYSKDMWLARLEASRSVGDHLFAWAMEKGHRHLPPLDGRELRLERLERYFQDFITRTAELPALKEERARARLQLAEITLAKGNPKEAAQRLEEALASAADLPSGPDLDLRLATDRLLMALLLQERNDKGAGDAFRTARKALEAVPQAEVDADRLQELLAVLGYHESRLLAMEGKDTEAFEKLSHSTEVLNRLVIQRPDTAVLRSELAECYLSSATILDGIGEMGSAREVRAQAAEEILELLKKDPGNLELRLDLAGCYGAMAEAAALSGDISSTETMSKAAAKLLEEYMGQRPDSAEARSRMAAVRSLMSGVVRDRGDSPEALRLINEGILLVEGVAVGESADPVAKYRLALLLWEKGRLLGIDRKLPEEVDLETRSADMLRKLLNSDYGLVRGEQIRRSLGCVLGDLGHAAQRMENHELARAAFGEAVSVWSILAKERPQNEEYSEGLAWSQQRLKEL